MDGKTQEVLKLLLDRQLSLFSAFREPLNYDFTRQGCSKNKPPAFYKLRIRWLDRWCATGVYYAIERIGLDKRSRELKWEIPAIIAAPCDLLRRLEARL